MVNSDIQHHPPGFSGLFLPDGDVVAVGEGDFLTFFLHFPRTDCISEIGRAGRRRETRLPNENAGEIFARGPVLLSIYSEGSERDAIISKIVDGRSRHPL